MAKTFKAAFHRVIQRLRPLPGGVQAHDGHEDAPERGPLVGKCPRALTARRIRALTDSMALVEQITRRISVSKLRKGTNSAPASSHNFTIAGHLPPQTPANS